MKRRARLIERWEVEEGSEIRSVSGKWIAETCFHCIYRNGHRADSPEHLAHIAVALAIVEAHNATLEKEPS